MPRIPGLRMLLACSAILLTARIGAAQTKVAVVSLQRAVLESDEIVKASAAMETKYKPRQQKIEEVQKEIQAIQQQLQAGAGKLTPQAEAELNSQGQRKQRDLQRMGDDLQADVNTERNDILGKSTQRMAEIVKKIAEEKSLDMVVDISNIVYFKPALDITAEALAAYNKAYPAPK